MLRFMISLIIGMALGIGAGLYWGWVVAPVQYVNSPVTSLDPLYVDDYTLMVADAFADERDVNSAVDRLRVLEVPSIPDHVQFVAERSISNSANVDDIRALVALSVALGRMTPIMEPYRVLDLLPGGAN